MWRALLLGGVLVPVFIFAVITVSTLGFGILIPAFGLGILSTSWPELLIWAALVTLLVLPVVARRAGGNPTPYLVAGTVVGAIFPIAALAITIAATGAINLLGDTSKANLSDFAIISACLGATGIVVGGGIAFFYFLLAQLFVFRRKSLKPE
ncbi:hypothetical protein [Microvirga alba]|uniref:Uncharacterized protein n=1 Tax=Microvirga alba TaxID=2791025 RepID=A0A931FMN1_9HYPH|nr:hypothetical protein [Microvirga alba]MBF9233239.1 hypothetical protein [Microvirga alba]